MKSMTNKKKGIQNSDQITVSGTPEGTVKLYLKRKLNQNERGVEASKCRGAELLEMVIINNK